MQHRSGVSDGPASVYYDHLEPDTASGKPTVVMIHGGAHSGSCWLHTVDGRPGWAPRFVARGYPVVLPDWPGTGRSGYVAPQELTGELVCRALGALIAGLPGPVIVMTHSMSGAYGWRLLEAHRNSIRALIGVAPGRPGNIQPEPEILSETADEMEVRALHVTVRLKKNAPFIATRKWVEQKIIGRSRFFPRALIDAYVASLLPVPGQLIAQRLNVHGGQLCIADPRALAAKPILIITGTEDIDHPRDVDGAIATWINEQGGGADFIWLGDRGIAGNGHMLMLEDNSDQIADIILDWLEEHG